MQDTRPTCAPRVAVRRYCRVARICAVVAGLWAVAHASNACNADKADAAPHARPAIADDGETTLQPPTPMLREVQVPSNAPLLVASAPSAIENPQAVARLANLPLGASVSDQAPIADALHLHLPLEDFEDTGPGSMKLSMAGLDVDADRSVAGGRAQLVAADDDRGRLIVESRLSWLFEYLQTDSTAAAFFTPGDKGIFAVQGLGYGSNWAILGSGLRWELIAGWNAYAGYDAQFNRQQLFHIGSAGVDYAW